MKHVHSYKKVNIGAGRDYYVFQCQDPSCSHYLPAALVLGKLSLCPRCDDPFVMGENHLAQTLPYCNNCKKSEEEASA